MATTSCSTLQPPTPGIGCTSSAIQSVHAAPNSCASQKLIKLTSGGTMHSLFPFRTANIHNSAELFTKTLTAVSSPTIIRAQKVFYSQWRRRKGGGVHLLPHARQHGPPSTTEYRSDKSRYFHTFVISSPLTPAISDVTLHIPWHFFLELIPRCV